MHDQLFKDPLRAFFLEFLFLFVPDLAEGIDPQGLTFLDPQLFTDVPVGRHRIADLVTRLPPPTLVLVPAQVPATPPDPHSDSGGDTDAPPGIGVDDAGGVPAGDSDSSTDDAPILPERVVVVHTEIESAPGRNFPYRVWEYNALLCLRVPVAVVSIAVLPFANTGPVRLVRYVETIRGQDYIKLEYWQIGLGALSAGAYRDAPSLLGVAVAALMDPGTEGKPSLKLALLRRVATSTLDEARVSLLVNFIETYLILDEAEQAAYIEQRGVEEDGIVEATELTWADRMRAEGRTQGIERGREEGIERGVLLGKRTAVLRLVRRRFGLLPEDAVGRIEALDGAALDRALDSVAEAGTLDAFLAAL